MAQFLEPGWNQSLVGLGIAVAIGFLIGLERERAEDKPVGVRSFALIGALGGLSALVMPDRGAWLVAAGLVALSIVLAAYLRRVQEGGMTTVIATLVVYLLGAAAVSGYWVHAIVLGGVIMILLYWKTPLHRWVDQLGEGDFAIVVRFVLITLVILPILPDSAFGPYGVFNPFNTWMMVVLIVTINLVGFIAFRLVGTSAGAWLAGLLGGLVSSTATTLSYAGMTRRNAGFGHVAALVILIASTVVYIRVLIELAVVAPALVRPMLLPALLVSAILLSMAAFTFRHVRHGAQADMPEQENPARIRQALAFAALYALILFAVAAARDLIGAEAVYAVAFVSGLTDVDALTLSVGQLFSNEQIGESRAWRSIFIATLSNLAFKAVAAGVLGSEMLRRWILGSAAIAVAAGVAIVMLWP